MEQSLMIETVASFPLALFTMLGSLPIGVWACVAFAVVAATLTRILDA